MPPPSWSMPPSTPWSLPPSSPSSSPDIRKRWFNFSFDIELCRATSNQILKANPYMWLQIVHILQNSKEFGYQVLCPLQIVKHDCLAKWTSFIPDLVAVAKTSETICEYCMAILKEPQSSMFGRGTSAFSQLFFVVN
ncbi:unnamed protein product [Cochlearia groenlandica]